LLTEFGQPFNNALLLCLNCSTDLSIKTVQIVFLTVYALA
jgi:hypothetical protein